MFGLSPKLKIFQCRVNMEQDLINDFLINDLEGIHKDKLAKAIQELSEQEQIIMGLYYEHEMEFKEIGEISELSEKEVSQILEKTMLKLRSKLLAEN